MKSPFPHLGKCQCLFTDFLSRLISLVEPLEMPKRPPTTWAMFFMDHLAKVKSTGKDVVPIQESAIASALWGQLPSAQRDAYEEKFKAANEKFKQDRKHRLENLTPEEIKLENSRRAALRAAGKKSLPRLKDVNAPKRPLSSYFRFSQDLRQSGKYSGMPVSEQAKLYGSAWAEAPKAEKDRYTELSRAAQEKYKVEKAAYDAKK